LLSGSSKISHVVFSPRIAALPRVAAIAGARQPGKQRYFFEMITYVSSDTGKRYARNRNVATRVVRMSSTSFLARAAYNELVNEPVT
jgi:hypothetical protein